MQTARAYCNVTGVRTACTHRLSMEGTGGVPAAQALCAAVPVSVLHSSPHGVGHAVVRARAEDRWPVPPRSGPPTRCNYTGGGGGLWAHHRQSCVSARTGPGMSHGCEVSGAQFRERVRCVPTPALRLPRARAPLCTGLPGRCQPVASCPLLLGTEPRQRTVPGSLPRTAGGPCAGAVPVSSRRLVGGETRHSARVTVSLSDFPTSVVLLRAAGSVSVVGAEG